MIWVFIGIFLVIDFVVVGSIVAGLVHFIWNPIAQKHPAVTPATDAERRNFQSFKIGLFNLGYAIHVTVDVDHLHLDPVKFGRKLGMRSASIPWDAIEYLGPLRTSSKYAKIKLGTETWTGPRWCLELADPPSESDADREASTAGS